MPGGGRQHRTRCCCRSGSCCLLLVDVIACTWRRVPLAGLVLLTVYSIPVSLLDARRVLVGLRPLRGRLPDDAVPARGRAGVPLGTAAGPAARRRPIPRASGCAPARSDAARSASAAPPPRWRVLLPALIPTLDLGLFGGGSGPGDGDVHIENPIDRPAARPAARRRHARCCGSPPTTRRRRTSASPSLTMFTDNEWRAGDREIPGDQRAEGDACRRWSGSGPRSPARSSTTRCPSTDELRLHAGCPRCPRSRGRGRRRLALRPLDDGLPGPRTTPTRRGSTWSMTGVRLGPRPPRRWPRRRRPSATSRTASPSCPRASPGRCSDLAIEVTAGQPTRVPEGGRRSSTGSARDGGFEYDLDDRRRATASDALLDFLDDRVGYCEQFASAMAVMARSLDIPARVAVGFLRPDRIGPDTLGVLRLGPARLARALLPGLRAGCGSSRRPGAIPGQRAAVHPAAGAAEPTGAASATPPAPAQRGAARPRVVRQRRTPNPTAPPATAPRAGAVPGAASWWWPRRWSVARAGPDRRGRCGGARRERRWATWPAPEAAWAELRDTMVDLGCPWPDGPVAPGDGRSRVATLRSAPTGRRLRRPAGATGADVAPEATAALDRIVSARRACSATPRPGSRAGRRARSRADVETCAEALAGGGVSQRQPDGAPRWLPRSVLRRHRAAAQPRRRGFDAGRRPGRLADTGQPCRPRAGVRQAAQVVVAARRCQRSSMRSMKEPEPRARGRGTGGRRRSR